MFIIFIENIILFYGDKQMKTITANLVADENERLDVTQKQFNGFYPFHIEPSIYKVADHLSPSYDGGYWDFYRLSNGGFFQAPPDDQYKLICSNGFEGVASSFDFGIIVCLYTYSTLSFKPNLQEIMSKHYHALRDFALDLPKNEIIFKAID